MSEPCIKALHDSHRIASHRIDPITFSDPENYNVHPCLPARSMHASLPPSRPMPVSPIAFHSISSASGYLILKYSSSTYSTHFKSDLVRATPIPECISEEEELFAGNRC